MRNTLQGLRNIFHTEEKEDDDSHPQFSVNQPRQIERNHQTNLRRKGGILNKLKKKNYFGPFTDKIKPRIRGIKKLQHRHGGLNSSFANANKELNELTKKPCMWVGLRDRDLPDIGTSSDEEKEDIFELVQVTERRRRFSAAQGLKNDGMPTTVKSYAKLLKNKVEVKMLNTNHISEEEEMISMSLNSQDISNMLSQVEKSQILNSSEESKPLSASKQRRKTKENLEEKSIISTSSKFKSVPPSNSEVVDKDTTQPAEEPVDEQTHHLNILDRRRRETGKIQDFLLFRRMKKETQGEVEPRTQMFYIGQEMQEKHKHPEKNVRWAGNGKELLTSKIDGANPRTQIYKYMKKKRFFFSLDLFKQNILAVSKHYTIEVQRSKPKKSEKDVVKFGIGKPPAHHALMSTSSGYSGNSFNSQEDSQEMTRYSTQVPPTNSTLINQSGEESMEKKPSKDLGGLFMKSLLSIAATSPREGENGDGGVELKRSGTLENVCKTLGGIEDLMNNTMKTLDIDKEDELPLGWDEDSEEDMDEDGHVDTKGEDPNKAGGTEKMVGGGGGKFGMKKHSFKEKKSHTIIDPSKFNNIILKAEHKHSRDQMEPGKKKEMIIEKVNEFKNKNLSTIAEEGAYRSINYLEIRQYVEKGLNEYSIAQVRKLFRKWRDNTRRIKQAIRTTQKKKKEEEEEEQKDNDDGWGYKDELPPVPDEDIKDAKQIFVEKIKEKHEYVFIKPSTTILGLIPHCNNIYKPIIKKHN